MEEKKQSRNPWIVNPAYDCIFFIFSPLLALLIGISISGSPFSENEVSLWGHTGSISNIFIGSFIMAHLVIVFFRSHANKNIFKLYPVRFTTVPFVLFWFMLISPWVLVSVAVIAIWWDVYHSSLQTFGIGRIYDLRQKNDLKAGRKLDQVLNLLIYAGPILAGATLMEHVDHFYRFSDVGSVFMTQVPGYVQARSGFLKWAVFIFGIPFLIYYIFAYWRFHQKGYKVSFQKVALLVSTAVCSIYTWGFNTFGEAFFIMNFFHAWQYFAIVWWSESKNMVAFFHLGGIPWGKPVALVLFLFIGLGYGFWAEVSENQSSLAMSVILVVSIMHFWYDGFIWSVQKKQIE